MNAIQFVREKLGISFEALANYLALPISQLSMSQSGRRQLPASANMLLMRLVNAINMTETSIEAEKKISGLELAQLNRQVLDKIQATTLQLATTKKKLAQLQIQRQQSNQFIKMANYLQQIPLEGSDSNREHLWLNALIGDANDTVIKSNYATRTLLELQIKVLEFTLEETMKLKG